jgi:hypothetical protein
MDLLVLTTLFHYLAILPFNELNKFNRFNNYVFIIITSTTLSVIWHLLLEPFGIIFCLDYLFAALWFLYDFQLSIKTFNYLVYTQVLFFNFLIFAINIIFNLMNPEYYVIFHSIWHLLSALKCYYISFLIKNFLKI